MVSSANVLKMTFQEALKPYEFQEWEDEAVDSYWMMSSPYPVTVLMVGYLTFVTYLGPHLMAERKPFNLKYTMMVYNIAQVIYNIWFLHLYFSESKMFGYMMQEACSPSYPPRNQALRLFSFKVTWVWLMSKVADLVDTMFFVLRKKQSHISFLHLYHHTHMVVIVWLYLKYVRGEQGIMIGLVNSVVHIIMYSYYFLSALGPGVQRYLWWKRYITWLQLFQFFVLMVFFVSLLAMCSTPPLQTAYNVYAALQGVIFTVLFLNFYFKSYKKTSRKSSKVTKSVENSSKHVKLGK
ncbi:elongation of very long chain fatty acids protein 7-like [Macrosteles quadrilineatus]|uniref:elongation of very long chain fatty acids protein 7-like n=1 Tax=Macrosteles quadrilineatus TaxID=74068 RepID=UPI0023E0A396|nr:elongation of very long chain fatty acids protein 7-like [Macrosteles quadrilineatus]